jgi:cold shock CspA family protein/ribosome-associated translation inhibitor RaiA
VNSNHAGTTIAAEVTFRSLKSTAPAEQWVRDEIAKLTTFYPRIMACRVAVESPHRHHRLGSQYHIRIALTVPGGKIVIQHEPRVRAGMRQAGDTKFAKHLELKTAHKNLRQAIDDAFKAAGRRLQDYARRQRGSVKSHEPLPTARVSKLFPDKGYGFITTQDGREIYFHRKAVLNRGFNKLKPGAKVSFAEEQGEKGLQASTVRIVASMPRVAVGVPSGT